MNFNITVSDFDRVYFSIYIYVEYSRHEEGRSPHAILLNLFFLENPVRCCLLRTAKILLVVVGGAIGTCNKIFYL